MKTIQELHRKEIADFKDEVTRLVHEMYLEEGVLYPVVFLLRHKQDKTEMVLLDGLTDLTESEMTRTLMIALIKGFVKEIKPISIAFASEGYVRSFLPVLNDQGEPIPELRDLATEIEAEKKEVVFINFETYDEESIIYWEIIRDEEEKAIDLKLLTDNGWQSKSKDSLGGVARMLNENYSALATEVKEQMLQKFNLN